MSKATIYRRGEAKPYEEIQRESWSRIKHILKSPRHYLHATSSPPEDKAVFARGDAVHVLTLEPERFPERFAIWTEGVRRGKAWEAFEAAAQAAGKRILTEAEEAEARSIAHAVRGDATARGYLTGGEAEVGVLWEALGVSLKSRIDYVGGALVELKTTRDASLDGFGREVHRYHYCAQAAMYQDAWEAATGARLPVVLVAVESEPPHVVQCYRLGEVELEMGRRMYRGLLEQLSLCRATGEWPSYAAGEVMLSLPRWAYTQEEAA